MSKEICINCGTIGSLDDIKVDNPKAISCCPERTIEVIEDTVEEIINYDRDNITSLKTQLSEAEEKLKEAYENITKMFACLNWDQVNEKYEAIFNEMDDKASEWLGVHTQGSNS